MNKECIKCKVIKDVEDFHKSKINSSGYCPQCKECVRAKDRERYKKNPEKRKSSTNNFRKKHPDVIKERKKLYRINNKEKLAKKNKDLYEKNKKDHLERCKKWAKSNKQKVNIIKARYKQKMRADPKFKLNESISKGIYTALSFKNGKGKKSWVELVGYSINDLLQHCEKKFTKGMSWENYGKNGWHLDHVIPKHYFKYDSPNHPAFKACWSLENLQPLWATTEIAMSYGEDKNYIGNLDKQHRVQITQEIEDFLKTINN